MIKKLARVTVFVRDEDEALQFYTETLGFKKTADLRFGPGFRWLTVAPNDQTEVEIVLHNPMVWHGPEEGRRLLARLGQGTPWVFYTDDCQAEYERLKAKGVVFGAPPKQQPHGLEAGFQDLYGNPYVLLQPNPGMA